MLSACCFGSIGPLTVVASRSGASLPAIQAWRYLTTALLLSAYGWWHERRRHGVARDNAAGSRAPKWWQPRMLFVVGGGQGMVAALSLSALNWIPAASVGFLFYTYPAWVAVIMAVRRIEPLTGQRVVALLLALGGIAAMVGAPTATSLHPTGVVLALGAAVFYAAYIPVLDMYQRGHSGLDVARAIATGGSIFFITWALVGGTLFSHLDRTTLLASLLQGALSTGAFLGFLSGLAALGPVKTAITCTVEPFWTSMLGVALLGQAMGAGTLLGGLGIMAAVTLLQWKF